MSYRNPAHWDDPYWRAKHFQKLGRKALLFAAACLGLILYLAIMRETGVL